MSDKEKEKKAYWKGYNDYKKCKGQDDPNPLMEILDPSYKPPSEHREAYRAGWAEAEREHKSKESGGVFLQQPVLNMLGFPTIAKNCV